VFDRTGSSASADGFAAGFSYALGAAALLSALAALAATGLPARQPQGAIIPT